MKIYTKTGDDGTTGLIGGHRVRKCEPRLAAYGTVDELNSHLGLAETVAPAALKPGLRQVMSDLFVVGAHLATPGATPANQWMPPIEPAMHERLETCIDEMEQTLRPLTSFILPGGSEAAARLHVARTVARRAERLVVELSIDHALPGPLLVYLNRLSDWLFVAARYANQLAGVQDVPWTGRDETA